MQQGTGAAGEEPQEIGGEPGHDQRNDGPGAPAVQVEAQLIHPLHHIVLPILNGAAAPAELGGQVGV